MRIFRLISSCVLISLMFLGLFMIRTVGYELVKTDYIHEFEQDINNLVDNNVESFFILRDFVNYFEFKLEDHDGLKSIELVLDNVDYNYKYKIYSSDNGYNYNEINYSKTILDSNIEKLNLNIKDKFIRIRILHSDSKDFIHINEIRFLDKYGNKIKNIEVVKDEPIINQVYYYKENIDYKDSISGLISRTLGEEYVNFFDIQLSSDDRENDYFTLYSENNKIILKGNNVNSIAVALNHYYEHYLNQTYSRFGNSKIKSTLPLPKVEGIIDKEIDMKYRYNYNYVAYGYSMAYWDFSDWEREIDWMALNGFNMALNLVGHEEVVRRFLSEFGFTFSEITEYLTSPIYLPWQFMGNISSIGGEMTPEWFEDRAKLSIKIQNRMNEFGIEPIHQLFIGYFPHKDNSEINTIDGSYWSRIKGPDRLDFNNNNIDLIARIFYDKQKEVLGDSKYFAGDLFHEGGNSYGYNVKEVSKKVLDLLKENMGNDSIWIIQSWSHSPSSESLEVLDRDNILILDLHSQLNTKWTGNAKFNNMSWSQKEFNNSNWIFGILNNFGGRNGLYGHSYHLLDQFYEAKYNSKYLKGIGQTSEAIGFNDFIDELSTELIFKDEVNMDEFLNRYVRNRYGEENEKLIRAFKILLETVYNPTSEVYHEGASESVINARPSIEITSASKWGIIHKEYDITLLQEAFKLYLEEYSKFKGNREYIVDLIDIASEVIIDLANDYYKTIQNSYKEGNFDLVEVLGNKFLYLIKLQANILFYNKDKSLKELMNKIDEFSYDSYFKDTLKYNKKTILTTWYDKLVSDDDGLRDYANTDFYDLIGTLYYNRWKEFFLNVKNVGNEEKYKYYIMDSKWIYDDNSLDFNKSPKNLKELLDLLVLEINFNNSNFDFLGNLMYSIGDAF